MLLLVVLVQNSGVLHGEVDAVQQHIGDVDGRHRDGVDEQNDDQAPDKIGEDLPHRLLAGVGHVGRLAGHAHDAEGKGHHDGDEGHGPESVGHRVMAKKDIDEKVAAALVHHLGRPGKDVEKGLDKAHQPEQSLHQPAQQYKDPVEQQPGKPVFRHSRPSSALSESVFTAGKYSSFNPLWRAGGSSGCRRSGRLWPPLPDRWR